MVGGGVTSALELVRLSLYLVWTVVGYRIERLLGRKVRLPSERRSTKGPVDASLACSDHGVRPPFGCSRARRRRLLPAGTPRVLRKSRDVGLNRSDAEPAVLCVQHSKQARHRSSGRDEDPTSNGYPRHRSERRPDGPARAISTAHQHSSDLGSSPSVGASVATPDLDQKHKRRCRLELRGAPVQALLCPMRWLRQSLPGHGFKGSK
jgi:hypothetical protein